MAIKTIKLRRATNASTHYTGLSNKTLSYGEPMYNEADKALVIGNSTGTSQCDALDRIDIVPLIRTRKEMFWDGTKDASGTITLNRVTDIDGDSIDVGKVQDVTINGTSILNTTSKAAEIVVNAPIQVENDNEITLNSDSVTSPITITSGKIAITQASDTTNGYLSSSDYAKIPTDKGSNGQILISDGNGWNSSDVDDIVTGPIQVSSGKITLNSSSVSAPIVIDSDKLTLTESDSVQGPITISSGKITITSSNVTAPIGVSSNKLALVSTQGSSTNPGIILSKDGTTYTESTIGDEGICRFYTTKPSSPTSGSIYMDANGKTEIYRSGSWVTVKGVWG